MKHKICFLTFFATIAGSLCLSPALAGTYSGGLGTAEDPFRIGTPADWEELTENSNDWSQHFILTADIDLQTVSCPLAMDNDNSEWSRFQGTPFTGVFDGQRHTLHHLSVNEPNRDYIGLIGYVGTGGQILNLGVEEVYIVGRGYIGGIVGWNEGTIRGCYVTGTVTGVGNSYDVGGLCGENSEGTISQCYTMATVEGHWTVGGLVGANYDGTITSCFATGYTYGTGSSAGGLVGWNFGQIISCYSTGTVYGNEYGGGLVGQNACEGTINSSYAVGPVIGLGPDSVVGGLVGDSLGFILSSFWDIETTGQTGSYGGEGKTTAEMKTRSTFSDAEWDFDNPWWMPYDSYPRLRWEKGYSGGSGTAENPYQISTVAEWQELIITSDDWGKNFVLLNDIDFGGAELSPVAPYPTPFTGVLDGNSHVLRNAIVNGWGYGGLFGRLGSSGQIRNLGVEDIDVTDFQFVGGLCGENSGTIINCYATGDVIGRIGGTISAYIGGLCGFNDGGTISNCFASGSVSGTQTIGGLCGENRGTISRSYATGSVMGWDSVGGLCGYNFGDGYNDATISHCYASGSVIGYGNCTGGLSGANNGVIMGCYATGSVIGVDSVGGLVGDNGWNLISQCYATGNVIGENHIGGLCGFNDGGTINECSAMGSVSGTSEVGGLCGYNDAIVSNCFWDMEISGQTTSSGGTGKTTAEMKTLTTFTNANWDFINVWDIGENQTYPYLRTRLKDLGDDYLSRIDLEPR